MPLLSTSPRIEADMLELALLRKFLHEREMHPLFEYATTQGPRKACYGIEPEGKGWWMNRDKGNDGFERFDYHEETYWRRLRP